VKFLFYADVIGEVCHLFPHLIQISQLIELRFCLHLALGGWHPTIRSFNLQLAPFRNDYPELAPTGEERKANFAKVEVRLIT
jgi:hypothetical protein